MALVDDLAREHVLPLFDGYEVETESVAIDNASQHIVSGWVDVTCDGVTGSVGVCGAKSALAATAPLSGVDPYDWAGELANLVAGRIRYGLLASRRVRLRQSTPNVSTGSELPAPGPSVCVMKLSRDGGSVRVWLALDGVEETPQGEEGRALAPGKAIFFDQ